MESESKTEFFDEPINCQKDETLVQAVNRRIATYRTLTAEANLRWVDSLMQISFLLNKLDIARKIINTYAIHGGGGTGSCYCPLSKCICGLSELLFELEKKDDRGRKGKDSCKDEGRG